MNYDRDGNQIPFVYRPSRLWAVFIIGIVGLGLYGIGEGLYTQFGGGADYPRTYQCTVMNTTGDSYETPLVEYADHMQFGKLVSNPLASRDILQEITFPGTPYYLNLNDGNIKDMGYLFSGEIDNGADQFVLGVSCKRTK